ncbi:hypothetical protein IPH25_03530 [bacterium]|nr:MAG: hypothetical protein IPG37_00520 [bacterium]QQR61527.1 MAG: hypothetical protein IPH25_03530 [bacterium]QQR62945.1 MAG: hypothetical protein IPH67_00460 [bacterium]
MLYQPQKLASSLLSKLTCTIAAITLWFITAEHITIEKTISIPVYLCDNQEEKQDLYTHTTITIKSRPDTVLISDWKQCGAFISKDIINTSGEYIPIPFSSLIVPPGINVLHCNAIRKQSKV